MHRQRQHTGAQPVGHKEAGQAGNGRQVGKGGLRVHGLGVIHHGGDSLLFQRRLYRIALLPAFQRQKVYCAQLEPKPSGITGVLTTPCSRSVYQTAARFTASSSYSRKARNFG